MKYAALLLPVLLLAACEPTGSTRPAEEPAAKTHGITISGSARTGISRTF
jgi:hypothetical protein